MSDFSYLGTRDGVVQIFRGGRLVSTLGKRDGAKFLARMENLSEEQAQVEMGRVTGKYKFGNERLAGSKRRR
jgi:hypothetical protein